jgi:hypothetical protein
MLNIKFEQLTESFGRLGYGEEASLELLLNDKKNYSEKSKVNYQK